MNITLFTAFDTKLNPYIILFKKALEEQGLSVQYGRDFNLNWLLSKGKSCDCIHLHWIQLSYTPTSNFLSSRIHSNLVKNRFIGAFLDFTCLLDFALAFIYAKWTGKVIVFTVHDLYDFENQSFRWKFQNEVARNIVFKFSNAIHVHNHYTRKLLKRKYLRVKKVHVIPHGNYIGYYPNQISRTEARRKLGIPKRAYTYLFLGLIRPYKGIEDLFEAFKNLESEDSILIVAGKIFGDKTYVNRLKNISDRHPNIIMVPEFIPDEDIQIYMKAADIFVLPYKNITTSGAAALALSFGRPVIAPDISSFPEVVSDSSGILYDVNIQNGLLLALKKAQKNRWADSTILSLAHNYDWEKIGTDLALLYKN